MMTFFGFSPSASIILTNPFLRKKSWIFPDCFSLPQYLIVVSFDLRRFSWNLKFIFNFYLFLINRSRFVRQNSTAFLFVNRTIVCAGNEDLCFLRRWQAAISYEVIERPIVSRICSTLGSNASCETFSGITLIIRFSLREYCSF